MQRITVLVAGDMAGSAAPFVHDGWDIVFHRWTPHGALPLLDGGILAFIDSAYPDIPAVEVCRRLRCDPLTAKCQIVMVLDNDDKEERRRAFAAGADGCMIGTLTRASILDRVLANSHAELSGAAAATVSLSGLTVDMIAHRARWQGKPLDLMPNDLRLLRYFVEHPGRIFTRSQLITALGKEADALDERTVDVWVGRLRRGLRQARVPFSVRTVRSLGYVLDQP